MTCNVQPCNIYISTGDILVKETTILIQKIEEVFDKPAEFGSYQGARKFKHGQLLKNVWFQYSYKNRAHIACESELEKKLCLLSEFDNNIEAYRPQPFKIELDGFSYTPDFVMRTKSGLYVIREAKHHTQAESKFYQERFNLIEEFCNSSGVDFEVFTEKELNAQINDNQRYLFHLTRGLKFSSAEISSCFLHLSQHIHSASDIDEIQDLLKHLDIDENIIFPMVLEGLIEIDLSVPITPQSPINLVTGGAQ